MITLFCSSCPGSIRGNSPAPKTLSPILPTPLNLRRPFQTPGVQTCAGGLHGMGRRNRSGRISSPRVSAAANAKMLVTPRAGMHSGEWRPTRLCAKCGAVKAASKTYTGKGRTRPAPRFLPLGLKGFRGKSACAPFSLSIIVEPCAAICRRVIGFPLVVRCRWRRANRW